MRRKKYLFKLDKCTKKNEQKEIITEQQFSNAWNLGPHGMIYY